MPSFGGIKRWKGICTWSEHVAMNNLFTILSWKRSIIGEVSTYVSFSTELLAYVQTLNGQTVPTTVQPKVTNAPSTNLPTTTPGRTTHAQTTSKSLLSCLDTFYCTKMCDYGYQTDDQSCPLCECINGTMIDTPGKRNYTKCGKHVLSKIRNDYPWPVTFMYFLNKVMSSLPN